MKNKIKLLAVISAMVMSFVFAGCQVESDSHEHSFSKEWTSDEANHWHVATCEHTEEVSDKAEHTFGEWKTTLEPTEEADGKKERTCTVCSYKEEQSIAKLEHTHTFAETWTSDEANHWHVATCEHTEEVSDKAEHTFGEWKTTLEPTEEADGKKERTCTVCSYKEEQSIAKLEHTHTFAETWTSDEANHWHVATCEHTEEVSGKAAHTFGEWKVTKLSTFDTDGEKERTCTVCSYNEKKIISKISEGFVKVTGGTITGSTDYASSDNDYIFVEGRTVTIQDMYVSDHEVTQAEYEKYCKYGSSSPSEKYGVGDNYPAYYVNWYDAIVYCNLRSIDEGLTPAYKIGEETDPTKWSGIVGDSTNGYCGPSSSKSTWNALTYDKTANGYRLPTEAEWEYIAREAGTSTTTYSGSNTIGDVAWYTSNSSSKTHEVKGKSANSLFIYDMSGNVWEWCYDWYSSSIDSSTADTGAASGSRRVDRGGSWFSFASYCAVSYRGNHDPIGRSNYLGFRVVRSSSK